MISYADFIKHVERYEMEPELARRYARCLYHVPGNTPSAWACSCDCMAHTTQGGNCPGTEFSYVPLRYDIPEKVQEFLRLYAENFNAGVAQMRREALEERQRQGRDLFPRCSGI